MVTLTAALLPLLAVCTPSPTHTYDVIVVGAGTSGITAAIQAARRPLTSVALLDEGNYIGGQLAAAGVTTMDGGSNPPVSISGLHAEYRARVEDYYAPHQPGAQACIGAGVQGCSEPRVSRQIFQEMLDDAAPPSSGSSLCPFPGVTVTDVLKSGNTVTGVRTGPGLTEWHAHVVIDATEYGDLIPMTGAAYRIGNRRSPNQPPDPNNCIDDITYTAVARQYGDPGSPIPPSLVMPLSAHVPARELEFHSLVTDTTYPGECVDPMTWPEHQFYRHMPDTSPNRPSTPSPLRTRSGVNMANDYHGYYRYCPWVPDQPVYVWRNTLKEDFLLDRSVRQTVICDAKLRTLQFLHYMQHPMELAAYAPWAIADDEYDSPTGACPLLPADLVPFERLMPPLPYVRESIRIEPVDLLTGPEIERTSDGVPAKMRAQESLAVGDYVMDIHNCKGDMDLEAEDLPGGKRPQGWAGPFQIPFKTFVPVAVDGFLPAEKNLGYTRLAAGSSRLQPVTMLVGQAAGAIAAVAVEHGIQPREVRPLEVQQQLLSSGAAISLDTFVDVPKGHPRWSDAQLVSTYDVMKRFTPQPTPGYFTFAVDDSVGRGYAAGSLVRAFRLATTQIPGPPTFQDVPATDPDYPDIEIMVNQGFDMSGCYLGPNYFCPGFALTRPQLARWLAHARFGSTLPPPGAQLYDDVPPSHPDYLAIQAVGNEGLMFSCNDVGTVQFFCPGTTATRGDLARSLTQVLFKYKTLWP